MIADKIILLTCLCIVFGSIIPCKASSINENESENGKGVSGLPLPRFASLRSNDVNLRTGPGTRYPIEWVFTHKGLPVEIMAEYEVWRRIKDPEGSLGWVHKSALIGKRSVITIAITHDLRDQGNEHGAVLAHIEPGTIGELLSCNVTWCKVKFDGIKGYLMKTEFWGAYPSETFN